LFWEEQKKADRTDLGMAEVWGGEKLPQLNGGYKGRKVVRAPSLKQKMGTEISWTPGEEKIHHGRQSILPFGRRNHWKKKKTNNAALSMQGKRNTGSERAPRSATVALQTRPTKHHWGRGTSEPINQGAFQKKRAVARDG